MADKKGYYRILGIAVNATEGEIKAAYRVRAKQAHPDKNPGRDTKLEFQLVAEAYGVLGDPVKRAQYDASEREPSREPVRCSSCRAAGAEPRYVVFLQVVSYVFGSRRSTVQGIFCPRCAWRRGLRASAVTWLFGWWGFPKGPFFTLHALAKNLFGGIRPIDYNARLLAHQVAWFSAQNRLQLARSLAARALKLAVKAGNDELVSTLRAFLEKTNVGEPAAKLGSEWTIFNLRAFAAQLALGTLAVASAAIAWSQLSVPAEWPFLGQRSREPAAEGTTEISQSSAAEPLAPFRVVAPAGAESYVVKLVDPQTGQPVITLTVRGGKSAQVSVPLGSYKLRYAASRLAQGEGGVFGPQTVYSEAEALMEFQRDGDRALGTAVELLPGGEGALRTRRINGRDF